MKFNYSYICGANVSIYVDTIDTANIDIQSHILNKMKANEKGLDAAAVNYTLNNSIQPVYSHHANKFDAIVLGREVIQGSIILNYKDFTYLYKEINPQMYVSQLIVSKAYSDPSEYSNYVAYNNLIPFNIYIVESGYTERGQIRVHLLSNAYITSRGQSIYADDQNIIEEYPFIAQSYTYRNQIKPVTTISTLIETEQKKTNIEEKSAQPQTTNPTQTTSDQPKNTNQEVIVSSSTESKEVSAENTSGSKTADSVVSNAGTASTVLPEGLKPEQLTNEKKSSALVIQDKKMKNDIRNTDPLLGKNPELTYVLVNNVLLPKLSHMSPFQQDETIENKPDQLYSQYTREHINKILDFTKDKRDNKVKINSLIDGIEYDIPTKYRDALGDKKPNLSYFENIYEDFNRPDQFGRPHSFFNDGIDSRAYTTSLSNIYRSDLLKNDDYARRPTVLFDAPTERDGVDTNSGLSNEQKINLNQKRMNYANQYKVLASEWNNSNNSYTYKNDFWLSEVLTPTGVKYEYPGRYYRVDEQNKMYIENSKNPNPIVYDSNAIIDTNMLWTKKGYFSDVPNYNEGFFDQTMTFLDSFFSKPKIQVDPYYAMYGIMTEETENSTVEERNKSIEKANELINHIKNQYLKTNGSDEELLQSLIALSKKIYYYRSNGEVYSLYDDWKASSTISTRSDRWTIEHLSY